MDKIKINNQVVAMRKFVKQAKIRVINKWVKEIKLLQNRKGDEDHVSKCKRKAERLLSGIALLQKMKPDTVSKMALSKAKDWKAILSQKNIPLEDRCLAVLANYGPVQAEVEKFYSANSYLVPKIATLVQEWEEKAKLGPQTPKRNNKAFQKSNKPFRNSEEETEVNLNQCKVSQTEEVKSKTENPLLKSLPHLIVRRPLAKEESEQSDIDNNASDSENADESMEGNEKFSEKDNLNSIDSRKILKISKIRNDKIGSNLNSSEIDLSSDEDEKAQKSDDESETPTSDNESETPNSEDESETPKSDDESVTPNSEDEEDVSNPLHKNIEATNKAVTSPKSKSMEKSVKDNLKHPKKSYKNKNTKEQSTFQKSYSPEPNSTKAVALINLNEMLDMDEIPINNSRTAVKTVEEIGKRKRDTFFLSGNGGDFSEGDNEGSDNGDTNNSPFRKKQCNNFSKKGSYNERFKNESNGFKSRQNLGNSPRGQNFGFREKGFKKGNKDYHSKEQSVNYGRNQGREENRFNNNRSNNFEKHDRRPGNQFNKNKKWNTFDEKDRKERKPFNNPNEEGDSKEQSINYGRNQGGGENRFNNSRSNNFEKHDRMPGNQFNKNKKWNTFDEKGRMERKPFNNPSGKTFVNMTANNKNRGDYSTNKRESFNKSAGKKDELPLHPSWEAKRKLKTPVNAKFQGKRVVFND